MPSGKSNKRPGCCVSRHFLSRRYGNQLRQDGQPGVSRPQNPVEDLHRMKRLHAVSLPVRVDGEVRDALEVLVDSSDKTVSAIGPEPGPDRIPLARIDTLRAWQRLEHVDLREDDGQTLRAQSNVLRAQPVDDACVGILRITLGDGYRSVLVGDSKQFRHLRQRQWVQDEDCLLYTSPSPRDGL